MKVYELRIENEAGERFVYKYNDKDDAYSSMYGKALIDFLCHLNVDTNKKEEAEYMLWFMDEIKNCVAKSDDMPHDSIPRVFVDKVSQVTGITYEIFKEGVK